ncbi:partial Sporulation kinase E, partial [Anaerolineae bacterium]
MDLVQSLLIANLIYIYFVYGLAFFVLGFAISLAPKPQLPSLATSLRFLGAFGIAHGFAEWTHVFDLAGFPTPGFIHIALLLVAGVCLVQFAARMLIVLEPHRQWVRQLPPSFIIAWLLVITFVDLFAGRMDALADAEMLVHYLLFFPGSALAAWAFFKQAQRIAPRPESLSRDMRLAIAFFVLHALTCGIFMPMEYSPTVAMINPMGLAITDMALLVIRTALAVGATFLFLSLLHTFETQRVNELEEAQRERLEAQEQARQAAEQRSRDLAKEKDRAESLYNSVLENANDAIFIHDLEGRFLDVNRTACERLGYTRAELLRLSVKQLDDPETAAHFDEAMKAFAKKGSVVGETRHVHKDGRCIPTEISAQLIEYKGQPAVLSVARDISERKRIETETQQRNHELDALYKEAEQRAERIAVSNEIIRTVSSSQSLHDVFLTF